MKRFRFVAAMCVVGLAGCTDLFAPNSRQSRLEENRDRWAAQNMTRYEFTLRRLCFCGFTDPLRISVSNGTVVAVTQISTGKPLDPNLGESIEGLFDFIE